MSYLLFSTDFTDLQQKLINEGFYYRYSDHTVDLLSESKIITTRFTHYQFKILKENLVLEIGYLQGEIIWKKVEV